jgi:hypothetical protein
MISCGRSGWLAQNLAMLLGIPACRRSHFERGLAELLDSLLVIQPELEISCHATPNRASLDSLDRHTNCLTKMLREGPSS